MVSLVRLGDDYSRVTLVKDEDAERNGLANAPYYVLAAIMTSRDLLHKYPLTHIYIYFEF